MYEGLMASRAFSSLLQPFLLAQWGSGFRGKKSAKKQLISHGTRWLVFRSSDVKYLNYSAVIDAFLELVLVVLSYPCTFSRKAMLFAPREPRAPSNAALKLRTPRCYLYNGGVGREMLFCISAVSPRVFCTTKDMLKCRERAK